MKLSIKRITPFVVAGGLILTGCNRTNATINENNIDNDSRPSIEYSVDDSTYSINSDNDTRPSIEYSVDDSTYSINSDNWEDVISNNIEGNLYEVSKNRKLSEEEACEYLRNLTGSNVSFEACKEFYINRSEMTANSIGTLSTIETLYVDHNVVCRVNTNNEYVYVEDGEETDISVIDLVKQGKLFTAENLEGLGEKTSIYTQVDRDSRVTINSTDFTTEYERILHPDKDGFFDKLMVYPEFVASFGSLEEMQYEILDYQDDSEYTIIDCAVCGPDGELAEEHTHFFCDNQLLFGYAGDYNLTIYLPEDDETVSLDSVQKINSYLDRTKHSQEDLITVHENPGYSAKITGKYSTEKGNGHSKTY